MSIKEIPGTIKRYAEAGMGMVGNKMREMKTTQRYINDLPSTIMGNSMTKHAKAIADLGINRPAQRRYVKGVLQTRLQQLKDSKKENDKMSIGYIEEKLKKYAND